MWRRKDQTAQSPVTHLRVPASAGPVVTDDIHTLIDSLTARVTNRAQLIGQNLAALVGVAAFIGALFGVAVALLVGCVAT